MSKTTARLIQIIAATFLLAISANANAVSPKPSTQLHAQRIGTTVVLRTKAKTTVTRKATKVRQPLKTSQFLSTADLVKHLLGN